MNKVIHGDCLEKLKELEDNSVDAVVTDPPYGLSFMGKKWDYDVPSVEIWQECLRVLKPGGYLLAFAGTRTQHRMAVRIEDAGFEIRDLIMWHYGSGFPKSLNIGKVINKFLKTGNASWNGTGDSSNGALGYSKLQHQQGYRPDDYSNKHQNKEEITEEKAKEWEGWGTALKPATEIITMARKPLSENTVAENCLKWGVGGINIDGSRVESREDMSDIKAFGSMPENKVDGKGFSRPWMEDKQNILDKQNAAIDKMKNLGRFPANLIHDGSDEVVSLFPNDSARFFYCPKASKSERNKGCEGLEEKQTWASQDKRESNSFDVFESDGREKTVNKNNHPTVKPIALMEYLVKLVSKEGAVVLDLFAGSGTTGVACKNLNRNYILIEKEPEYIDIIHKRLNN